MIQIEIKIIPNAEQRVPGVGDWYVDDEGVLQIRVSETGNPQFNGLLVIHELVETLVESLKQGDLNVPRWLVVQTDKYDETFEKRRHKDDRDEPGYEPSAPYYHGHMLASAVEHLIASLLRIDYNEYLHAIDRL